MDWRAANVFDKSEVRLIVVDGAPMPQRQPREGLTPKNMHRERRQRHEIIDGRLTGKIEINPVLGCNCGSNRLGV